MAVKDAIGGWKYNAFIYKSHKACSTLKFFFGGAWAPFLNSLGIENLNCPLREV